MEGEERREEVRRNDRWKEYNRGGHWVESNQLREGEKRGRDKREEKKFLHDLLTDFENKYQKSEEEYFKQIHL